MRTLWQDVRYAARVLRARPAFTAAAALSLALGVGACTAIFSIVDAVLIRPLPYPEAARVVQLKEVSAKGALMPVAEPNYADVRARNHSLEAVAEYSGGTPATMTTTIVGGSEPVRAPVYAVSGEFFRVLGVAPVVGRAFLPEELKSGAPVAVVSHGFWRRQLGGRTDLSAVGRQLKQENGESTDAADFALVPLQEYLVGGVRQALVLILAAVGFLLLVACTNVVNLLLAQVTARRKEFAVRAALGAGRLRLARQFVTENLLLALAGGALGALLSFWVVDLILGLNQGSLPRADEISVNGRALAFTLALSLLLALALGLLAALRAGDEDLQTGLRDAARGQA